MFEAISQSLVPRPSIVITGFIIAHVQYVKILT